MSKKQKIQNKSDVVIDSYYENDGIISDPNGSWTGVPLDKRERPIQDADDL